MIEEPSCETHGGEINQRIFGCRVRTVSWGGRAGGGAATLARL